MFNEYFNVIEEYHSKGFAFELKINWNIEKISGEKNANGYIVQYFRRQSQPANFQINDVEYYEAWKIENGCNIDKGTECDDSFAVCCSLEEMLQSSLNNSGKFILDGDVFWIPQNSKLYSTIDSWSNNTVEQANGLRSNYTRPDSIDEYFVFKRPQFIHEWSLLGVHEIEKNILASLLCYCPNNTKRDICLATNLLNDVFEGHDEKMQKIKQNIFQKWEKEISNK